jgi:hypothetical protein
MLWKGFVDIVVEQWLYAVEGSALGKFDSTEPVCNYRQFARYSPEGLFLFLGGMFCFVTFIIEGKIF